MTATVPRLARFGEPHPVPLLLVEESVSVQVLLRESLVDCGWDLRDLVVAGSLGAARALLTDRTFAAILLDLSLPDATGLEAVSVMSAAAPGVPLVVITAHADDAVVLAALAEGADEFVSKHDLHDAGAVAESVHRAVERRRDRPPAPLGAGGDAFDSLAAPTVVLDGSGRILAANRSWWAAAEAGGADRQRVGPGVSYLAACETAFGLWSEGGAEAGAGIRDVLAGRRSSFSLDYPCHDGDVDRWFTMRVSPLGPRGGGAVVTHLDVSDLWRAEASLRQDRRRLAGAVDETLPIFALIDEHATVLDVSPRTRHLLGLSPEQTIGTDGFARIEPADRAAALRVVQSALAEPGVTHRVEVRALDGHGRWRDLDLFVVNLLADERVGAIVVAGSDVTAARLAQVAARLESRLLQRLPAAVVVTDDRDVIVYWNDRAAELFGYEAAAVLGKTSLSLNIAEARDRAAEIMSSVAAGERWEGGYDARRADGTNVPIHTTLEGLVDEAIDFRGIVSASVDISDQRQLEADLAFSSLHDPLTGLPNRRLLVDQLESALARSRRSGGTTAVHFIDLDHFKAINDGAGTDAGDLVLRAVGQRLQGLVQQGDLVGRLGGDEFALCSEEVESAAGAVTLAQNILELLAEPVEVGGRLVAVTGSIGVALSGPDAHAEALIRNATTAMHTAKESGRNRVEIFDDEVHALARHRHQVSLELVEAIEAGQIEVHFQPEIAVATGRLAGFEALVRWRHPERGLVPPDQFIDIAEESGVIGALGDEVLAQSCAALSAWLEAAPEAMLEVAVNVSTRQLVDPRFPERVALAIAAAQVPPGRVCLEVTETALLDADAAERALRSLKEIGVLIAIDDFGTGYSSLNRLKRFPVDYLKVDRSFVDGLGVDPEDDVIVSAVVHLGHSLGLRVIAEGIERLDQLDRVAALGCELGQGYLWQRPVPAAAAHELVTTATAGWATPTVASGVDADADDPPIDARAAVGLLAHELAAPLTALAGFAELMVATDDPSVRARAAKVIGRNARLARSALALVSDVAAVEEGTLRLEREPTVLGSVVSDAVSLAEARLDATLAVDVELTETLLSGDADRLVELVGNLLTNASKYSPAGGRIRVWTDDSVPGRLRLHVTDAGPGVPSHRVGLIFRKFGRADRLTRGTGLGLFLSRGIARAHGGELLYRQAPGGGADFVLELPLADAAEDLD